MEQIKQNFMDRPMRLRWVMRVVVILIVIGLLAVGFEMWQQYKLRGDARDAVRAEIKSKGVALAQTIAITSRDDILKSRYGTLQEYFGELVHQPNVKYLIIVTADGRAVVHTDAKFQGKTLDDEVSKKAADAEDTLIQDLDAEKSYDIAVPVMAFTRKAGVVRVGVSYGAVEKMFE